MADCNSDVTDETLEARELVKTRICRTHWNAIDEGKLDGWGLMTTARAELLRKPPRKDEE